MAKKVTATFTVSDDVSQNEFKNWVKSCPFSPEGGQNLRWENIEDDLDDGAEKKTEAGSAE